MNRVNREILKTLASLPASECYGFPLLEAIRERHWRCRFLSLAGMYIRLSKLEDMRLVRHEWGPPLVERGGSGRKYWILVEYCDAV